MKNRVINSLNDILKFEIGLLLITTTWWFVRGPKTVVGYSDALFVASTIAMVVGLIFALTNSSRRHYYKYLRAKDKGTAVTEVEYKEQVAKRKRHTGYGALCGISGVIGMALSAIIAVV